jgi:hypothetical protein
MTQLLARSSNAPDSTSHLPFGLSNCPVCEQPLPPDKIEEIAGRIAAREREKTLAIRADLEQEYASDKAAVEAGAKAAIEGERQLSAKREQDARDKVQRAAETFINKSQAQAEQEHTALVAGWEHRIAQSESARNAVQETAATLQAQIVQLRKDPAGAIEAVKAEAKEREAHIQNQSQKAAESAAAERIKQLEATHYQSEAALRALVTTAEADRIAAEENRIAAISQLEELQRIKDTEVNHVRQEAAAELALVRQSANQEAETRFRDTLAARDDELAKVSAKATAAETKLVEVSDQHSAELDAQLKTQREVLERRRKTPSTPKRRGPSMKTRSLRIKSPTCSGHWRTRPPKSLGKGQR